eukprot:COSAG06_NODE_2399_length_6954_cov_6.491612_4_plen_61_part_00
MRVGSEAASGGGGGGGVRVVDKAACAIETSASSAERGEWQVCKFACVAQSNGATFVLSST